MGIFDKHPAVFVRVANTGVIGYVTWKSAEVDEKKGLKKRGFGSALWGRFPEWECTPGAFVEERPIRRSAFAGPETMRCVKIIRNDSVDYMICQVFI